MPLELMAVRLVAYILIALREEGNSGVLFRPDDCKWLCRRRQSRAHEVQLSQLRSPVEKSWERIRNTIKLSKIYELQIFFIVFSLKLEEPKSKVI